VRVIIAHGPCKSSLCIVPVLTDYLSSPKRTMLGGQYINVSPGPRVRGPGSWASWALGPETWVRGTGSWVLHPGSWVPSSGSLALGVLGPGSRVLGRGPWVLGPELAGCINQINLPPRPSLFPLTQNLFLFVLLFLAGWVTEAKGGIYSKSSSDPAIQ